MKKKISTLFIVLCASILFMKLFINATQECNNNTNTTCSTSYITFQALILGYYYTPSNIPDVCSPLYGNDIPKGIDDILYDAGNETRYLRVKIDYHYNNCPDEEYIFRTSDGIFFTFSNNIANLAFQYPYQMTCFNTTNYMNINTVANSVVIPVRQNSKFTCQVAIDISCSCIGNMSAQRYYWLGSYTTGNSGLSSAHTQSLGMYYQTGIYPANCSLFQCN